MIARLCSLLLRCVVVIYSVSGRSVFGLGLSTVLRFRLDLRRLGRFVRPRSIAVYSIRVAAWHLLLSAFVI